MDLTNEQNSTLIHFKKWLYDQKESIDNGLQLAKNVNVELNLKSEYFRLEDYLMPIIDRFLLENYRHLMLIDEETGDCSNIKVTMDFQEELGFIKLLIRFIR